MTVKPQALEPGQEVGIIAPAGPVNPAKLRAGLEILTAFGFKPVLGPHLFKEEGYLAGKDIFRLGDFHEMIGNRSIKAVFCARGGYGSARLLDRIDYDLIRRNPKIIVGFSDITALLLGIWKKTDLITFHGSMLTGLKDSSRDNLHNLINLLRGESEIIIDLESAGVYHPGKAEGILMGGNLSLISHLTGTPYLPPLEGSILFLEDKGEPPYRLDRMLNHLHLSGSLKNIKGLLLGGFENCGTDEEKQQVINNCLSDLDIPIIRGCPFGHGDKNITLPIGVKARFNTEEMILKILEQPVLRD